MQQVEVDDASSTHVPDGGGIITTSTGLGHLVMAVLQQTSEVVHGAPRSSRTSRAARVVSGQSGPLRKWSSETLPRRRRTRKSPCQPSHVSRSPCIPSRSRVAGSVSISARSASGRTDCFTAKHAEQGLWHPCWLLRAELLESNMPKDDSSVPSLMTPLSLMNQHNRLRPRVRPSSRQ